MSTEAEVWEYSLQHLDESNDSYIKALTGGDDDMTDDIEDAPDDDEATDAPVTDAGPEPAQAGAETEPDAETAAGTEP